MTAVKGKGHIWREYWIDCCKCDHHQPLAASCSPSKAARIQGWRRKIAADGKSGPWVCPACIEDAAEIRDIKAGVYAAENR